MLTTYFNSIHKFFLLKPDTNNYNLSDESLFLIISTLLQIISTDKMYARVVAKCVIDILWLFKVKQNSSIGYLACNPTVFEINVLDRED